MGISPQSLNRSHSGILRAESAAVDPWGRFLYVSNYFDGVFSAYQIAANGTLTPVAGSPFLTGPNSGSVVVDPLGRFVYLVNLFDIVSGYRIAGNGALTPLPGSPFLTGFSPSSMAVSP
jgi:6-phosphogluconolactonase